VKRACAHRFSSPRRQYAHVPQVLRSHAMPTRCPTVNRVHPRPSASTVPTI
jgi:hypothetical protein